MRKLDEKHKRPDLSVGPRDKPGNFLRSHTLARAVPSGLKGLTSVFGMGTGGSPSLWSPRTVQMALAFMPALLQFGRRVPEPMLRITFRPVVSGECRLPFADQRMYAFYRSAYQN